LVGANACLGLSTSVYTGYQFDNVATLSFIELVGLPHGHTLAGVKIKVQPTMSGHGGQPASLPALTLYKQNSAGSQTMCGTTSYPSQDFNVQTYEAGFELAVTYSTTIDRTGYTYLVAFQSESGSNSADVYVYGLYANVTINANEGGPDFRFW
jgi:hypothetical protein